jgi:hypothetical protein
MTIKKILTNVNPEESFCESLERRRQKWGQAAGSDSLTNVS